MPEQTDAEKPTTEETPAAAPDPRESKAFKAVTGQLSERDAQIEKLTKKLEKFTAADEARTMAANEEKGEYTKNLETLTAKIAAMEADAKAAEGRIATQAVESDVRMKLVAAGCTTPKAQAFVLSEYMALEDKPDADAWIEQAAAGEDFAIFFAARTKVPSGGAPAPRAGSASNGTGNNKASQEQLLAAGDTETMRRVFNEALGKDTG
ncbi:MAG: hypothetical protein GY832_23760 [Chloroflexi bacterium]|nr:hypothetical protein [Chloroflexota bacterium]